MCRVFAVSNVRNKLSPLALGFMLNMAWMPVYAETESASIAPPLVTVKAFHITGSRAFSEDRLRKLVEHSVGQQLTRSELLELADSITTYYQKQGFLRAHAIIPPQNFADGVVHFVVTTAPVNESPKPVQRVISTLAPDARVGYGSGDSAPMLLERARWFADRDHADLALESLDKLFSVAPDHPAGLLLQAQLEIQSGKPKEAQLALNTLRRVQPGHPAIARMESLLHTVGRDKAKLGQARALVKEAALLQDQASQLRAQGKEHEANARQDQKVRRYQKAIAIFHQLFPDGPPSAELTLEYWAMVASTPQGWEPARKGIARLTRDNPGNLRYRLALAAHENSRLPLNRQALQVIIDISKDPDYLKPARQAWRSVMLRLADTPAALPLLRDYLVAEPSDSAVREKRVAIIQAQVQHSRLLADPNYQAQNAGLAHLDNDELDAAEPLLQQAVNARPKDGEAVGGMGLLRLRQGRHKEAKEYFEQAAHLNGDNSKKWNSLIKVARFWQLLREARAARTAGDFALAENRLNAALVLDPNQADAIVFKADLQADRSLIAAAAATYRRALTIDPLNSAALEGLITLYRQQGMPREAHQTVVQLSPAQRNALGATLKRIEADMLREQAERLLANGQRDEAITRLEAAVQLDGDDPWLRFALAKLYAQNKLPKQGQALFDDLLARYPNDADALYTSALYQSNLGEYGHSSDTLARIPSPLRSVKTSILWSRNLVQLANRRLQSGHKDAAKRLLQDAETQAANDEEASFVVALAWGKMGEYRQADSVFERLRNAHTPPSVRWHLRHAEYLALNFSPELLDELVALDVIAASLSPEELQKVNDLQASFVLHTVNAYLDSGQLDVAHQKLTTLLQNTPHSVPLLLVEAHVYWTENQWQQASSIFAHVLALNPYEPDARSGLIETQLATGNRASALAQLDEWSAGSATESLFNQLQLVDLYLALNESGRARKQLDPLLVQYPNNSRALNQALQIAQREGRQDAEIAYLQKSFAAERAERDAALGLVIAQASNDPVAYKHVGFEPLGSPKKIQRDWKEKKLAALIDRRTDWLSGAIDMRSRSGTPGLSQFNSTEIPVEYKKPWHDDDEVFFRTDYVRLDAGSTDPTSTNFGSMLLCPPPCAAPGLLAQSAQGMGLTVGYHSDVLRADIGVTPRNFAVSNIVGGVRHDGDIGQLSYSLEASRRPVTGSLLSFAGTRDPNTGQVWGGVVATGGRLGLSLDKGETFGFWSSLGLHKLTGSNVLSNDRLQLMAGGQWRVVNEENRLFALGLTGMYWRHTQNAGEYTFGHGGYYSPQSYLSLSLPVIFGERYARFSYTLRGAVSQSQSQIQSADYYPTDPALQTQAVALSATNFITPVYGGGAGSGTGYSLRGSWEYQIGQPLFVGGLLSIERSDYYAPNRALFYLRYSLDRPAAQPVSLPPLPVEPSSQL